MPEGGPASGGGLLVEGALERGEELGLGGRIGGIGVHHRGKLLEEVDGLDRGLREGREGALECRPPPCRPARGRVLLTAVLPLEADAAESLGAASAGAAHHEAGGEEAALHGRPARGRGDGGLHRLRGEGREGLADRGERDAAGAGADGVVEADDDEFARNGHSAREGGLHDGLGHHVVGAEDGSRLHAALVEEALERRFAGLRAEVALDEELVPVFRAQGAEGVAVGGEALVRLPVPRRAGEEGDVAHPVREGDVVHRHADAGAVVHEEAGAVRPRGGEVDAGHRSERIEEGVHLGAVVENGEVARGDYERVEFPREIVYPPPGGFGEKEEARARVADASDYLGPEAPRIGSGQPRDQESDGRPGRVLLHSYPLIEV